MVTSAPITENVELLLATGRGAPTGEISSGFFENMGGILQIPARIDHAAVDPHLEMQVRASRTAGAADLADSVARSDPLSDLGECFRHMRVARQQAIAVADLDHVAVAVNLPDEADRA